MYEEDILVTVKEICPFYRGLSLYERDLASTFVSSDSEETNVIELHSFQDTAEQVSTLKKIFEYCQGQESGIENSLFHDLGFFLRVPPIFLDQLGQEYVLDANATVYDTIRQIYLHIGSLNNIKKWNLVLDDGTCLSSLNLEFLVSEEIPNLEILYRYYEENEYELCKQELFFVAFESNDEDLIRAMALEPFELLSSNASSQLYTVRDLNFTMQNVKDWILGIVSGELKSSYSVHINLGYVFMKFGSSLGIVRDCVLQCVKSSAKMRALIELIENMGLTCAKSEAQISWREVKELAQEDVLVEFLCGVVNDSIRRPRDAREKFHSLLADISLPSNDYYNSFIFGLDDVEIFYMHYRSNSSLTIELFRSNKGEQIKAYVFANEPALHLYVLSLTVEDINSATLTNLISNLSRNDLYEFFYNIQYEIYVKDELFSHPLLPEDLVNNVSFLHSIQNARDVMNNPLFTNYTGLLKRLANIGNTLEFSILMEQIICATAHIDGATVAKLLAKSDNIALYTAIVRSYTPKSLPIPTFKRSKRHLRMLIEFGACSVVYKHFLRGMDEEEIASAIIEFSKTKTSCSMKSLALVLSLNTLLLLLWSSELHPKILYEILSNLSSGRYKEFLRYVPNNSKNFVKLIRYGPHLELVYEFVKQKGDEFLQEVQHGLRKDLGRQALYF
jgi:hypothetical protein